MLIVPSRELTRIEDMSHWTLLLRAATVIPAAIAAAIITKATAICEVALELDDELATADVAPAGPADAPYTTPEPIVFAAF